MLFTYTSILHAILLLLAARTLWGIIRAVRSPLSKIPGPWYSPLTTLHLNYIFSTGTIWKLVERSHARYGSVVRLGPRQVWVADRDAIRQVLVGDDLPKVAMYAEISRDRRNPGLFGEIRPEPHRRLRKFLSPAFSTKYVDGLEVLFKRTVLDLLDKYQTQMSRDAPAASRNGLQVDLMEDLHNVALDIMGESSFGKGFGQTKTEPKTEPKTEKSMDDDGYDDKVWRSIPRAIFDGLARRYQTVYIKKLARAFGWDITFDWPAEMITAIDCLVRRRCAKGDDGSRPDLLQHMIDEGTRPTTGTAMSARDIVDQMSEILLAGSETTSGTIGCLFLELARNPHVRAKLLSTLPARPVSDTDLVSGKDVRIDPDRYGYLEACIKENLRLHPIASEMGRRTGDRWVELAGYSLPPHTVVSASYRDLHRNAKYWPEPNRFWPERWLSEDKRCGAPAPDMSAYYPFSAGKHSCIGINFAWAEMRMVAANLLSRFDVIEVPGQQVDFRQYITMQFSTGHWSVVLKPRLDMSSTKQAE